MRASCTQKHVEEPTTPNMWGTRYQQVYKRSRYTDACVSRACLSSSSYGLHACYRVANAIDPSRILRTVSSISCLLLLCSACYGAKTWSIAIKLW